MIRLRLPLLKAGNRPMVVNVGSILGHRGIPCSAEYCASKFALQGLSESLRAEFARAGHRRAGRQPRHDADRVLRAVRSTPQSRPGPNRRGIAPDAGRAADHRAPSAAGEHEIVISAPGKLLVWANRLFPRVLDAHFGPLRVSQPLVRPSVFRPARLDG